MSDTPTSAVLRPAELPMVARGGGARTIPMVTRRTGSRQMLNGITIFEPGAQIGEHFHNCEEAVMVLEGDAVAVLGGVEHRLGAGDTTWIQAGIPHYFRNASDSAEMRIFWTYASVEATRTLVKTGETRPVSAEHAADKVIRP